MDYPTLNPAILTRQGSDILTMDLPRNPHPIQQAIHLFLTLKQSTTPKEDHNE